MVHLQLLFILLLATSAFAGQNEKLAQETEDPTAPLPTITLKDDYTPEFWHQAGARQSYALTVTNPFRAWNQPNLLGVNLTYNTGTAGPTGAGLQQILDLVVFDYQESRIGVGLTANLAPPSTSRESLQYGPAFGFVSRVNKCNFGVVDLNYLSADMALSAFQLIAGCDVGNNWTLSTGGFLVTYDWRAGKLLEVPISIQIGKVFSFLGQPLKAFINPRYNIQNTDGSERWTITVGFTLIADPSKVFQ